ncbi:MAG: YfiR family protein, partial [Bacteroidota bacterium]
SKSSEVYVVSIMGDPALLSQLKNITAERQVNGRSIKILPYSKNQSLQDINILFISKNKAKNFEALKDEALTNSIVLITESDGLAEAGASINFKMLDERLNFDLNQTSFKKANVVVSEAIKKLATLVE